MLNRYENGTVLWFDVVNPTSEEIRTLATEAKIPLELTGDLTTNSPHDSVDWQKGVFKLNLHFPVVKRTDMITPHEVKFIATKSALVTIRFEDIQSIEQFRKDFEIVSMLKRGDTSLSGARLLTTLLSRFYRGLDDKLDFLTSRLNDIDTEIFSGHEKEMVLEIAAVGRRLINFRQAVEAHEHILGQLYTASETAFNKQVQKEVLLLSERHLHIMRRLGRISGLLQELRETNNSLITTKQNEIMKTLTIMAFITFPLTLVSSMFGMNTISTPIVGTTNDFWIIVSFMSLGFTCFFVYFKYKRWI